jgi:hypothetical protein
VSKKETNRIKNGTADKQKRKQKMTLTQKLVLKYCEENNLVITGWNWYNKETQNLEVVNEMPVIEEWQGAAAHVEENANGIQHVNCFYTNRRIKNSYPRLRTLVNGKWVNVKR